MAEANTNLGSVAGPSGNNEDHDRSFDGFEEEDEKEEGIEISGEGGRRRIFSKELRYEIVLELLKFIGLTCIQ